MSINYRDDSTLERFTKLVHDHRWDIEHNPDGHLLARYTSTNKTSYELRYGDLPVILQALVDSKIEDAQLDKDESA